MQGYLIVKRQINQNENAISSTSYKVEEWIELDHVARATIHMHLSEAVYYTIQSCPMAHKL